MDGVELGAFGAKINGIDMGLQNKKSLGQHWLKDRIILDEITNEAVLVDCSPICLEIGPGLGTLTSSLLKRFSKVLAVEYDEKLAKNLPNSFPGKNLEVVNMDILKFDLEKIQEKYVVVGNIPYYITSPIIMRLLTACHQPEKIVLLIQKEVAKRITATPGNHTFLSLSVQNYAEVEYGIEVPREYFTPPPKVDSATIILTPKKEPLINDNILSFAKQAFKNPRKKLSNNLNIPNTRIKKIYQELDFNQNIRPADLTHHEWLKLYQQIIQ